MPLPFFKGNLSISCPEFAGKDKVQKNLSLQNLSEETVIGSTDSNVEFYNLHSCSKGILEHVESELKR